MFWTTQRGRSRRLGRRRLLAGPKPALGGGVPLRMAKSRGVAGTDSGAVTLIELLVVIVILGIVAAIAIPMYINQRGKAQEASAETLLRNLSGGAAEGFLTSSPGSTNGGDIIAAVADRTPSSITVQDASTGVQSSGPRQVVAMYVASENTWRAAVLARPGRCTNVAMNGTDGGGVAVTRDIDSGPCAITTDDVGTLVPVALAAANFQTYGVDPYGGASITWRAPLQWVAGKLQMTEQNPLAMSAPGSSPALSNGAYEADVKVGAGRPGVGMIFRASTSVPGGLRGYSLQVDPGLSPGKLALYQWVPNPASPTQAKEVRLTTVDFPAGFDPYTTNKVRVEIVGNEMKVYLKGSSTPTMTYAMPADAPTGSQYGFRNWGTSTATQPNEASSMTVTPYP